MKALLTLVLLLLAIEPTLAQQAPPWGAARPSFAPTPPIASPSSPAAPSIHPAVARIVAPGEGSVSYGSGTLVYANADHGLVVTNWHVVNEATGSISVHFPDGFYSLGSIQRVDKDWDLALIAIRRPNAQPVRLADHAPRPGETLTIAGYGSGQYRSASGLCTQYVAPGTTFPFEMVEVAVSARQGDSGGPIFNSQGELAGVLFGEGQGRTSGSYCGRVKWFLASVAPEAIRAPALAQTPLAPVPSRPRDRAADSEPSRVAPGPAVLLASQEIRPNDSRGSQRQVPPAQVAAPAVAPGTSQSIGWEDVAGHTLGEQVKAVLAGVGVLALILHTLRWLSAERAATS